MNKKLIVLTIAMVLLVVVGGTFAFMDSNKNNEKKENTLNQNKQELSKESTTNDERVDKENNINTSKGSMGKVLIVYYSWSGNTKTVANFIHNAVGGDIIELEPKKAYTENMNELSSIALKEKNNNTRPELKTKIDNIENYDTIFLGYPNWWSDMPMLMYTFLDEYDLSGKTIAPFVTHGESGLSGTPDKIQKEEPNSKVTEGLAVQHDNIKNSEPAIKQWLSKIGF